MSKIVRVVVSDEETGKNVALKIVYDEDGTANINVRFNPEADLSKENENPYLQIAGLVLNAIAGDDSELVDVKQ